MDIDELDQLLLDDYDGFNNNQQQEKTNDTFDPLAQSSPSGRNAPPAVGKRRPYKRLDADLLLSSKGLTRLRYEAPSIKFQGKGYEDTDLRKLMDYYQMWAHNLYPRLQFSDFARAILKTTANPRVKAKLHEWQDEHREKTDEYARIAREQGENAEEGEEENGDNQEQQASSDNEDSDQDMNDVFMDYLVGVKSGAISIEDAPPVPEQNNDNDNNPRPNNDTDDNEEDLFFKPASERDPRPGPGSPMDISTTTPQRPTLSKETSNTSAMKGIPSDDDDDDDNEPLFMNRRPRRITTEDEDMSE
ncbi:predicted protein [Lichtheimia corymbifera JMRC:FSU:9682]|uniref:Chromosome segregation in meiosis protein n=1 Tax=Lichtheimia corymbifera JMRC:FSU:9682 TaxID=1263082 RepID=A0A068RIV8_9FUNG|nr:predicted protein [Lichtheimia corymbifera JMRC:FSU:9682]